ncbi:phosphoenolpyruvate carboxylase [Parasaccharibacter sp. TMW2.1890]|uniref:phosphoenolpyruvate carboxylase n=1 Tax=Parasaccharibacter sp. TMW2.1890 TaxID=2039289 RepID=UPI002013BA23|nr:phosphoenolpyruvate carboxylase [Parasaccharibacter sp. TMW2.1890]MCL1515086.1 phosphoenolpyruvate carboxylase [Parasaccharibacter sp. TMW2.1890]
MPDCASQTDASPAELIESCTTALTYSPHDFSNLIISLAKKAGTENGLEAIGQTVRLLRDRNFMTRADALRRYVGLEHDGAECPPEPRLRKVAEQLVAQARTPDDLSVTGFAAVFTAHPTFALANDVYELLARRAEDPSCPVPTLPTHRRSAPPTLDEEQSLALAAITRGRDALDSLTMEILQTARRRWPEANEMTPAPVRLASWVGFDTDGRNDIGWWDTIRIRLGLKIAQLERLLEGLEQIGLKEGVLSRRVAEALAATQKQRDICPRSVPGQTMKPEDIARFAHVLIDLRETALLNADELRPLFREEAARLDGEKAHRLDVMRTGFLNHGLGLSHIHTRLNAAQIYNVARTRLGLTDDPTLPFHRRALLSHIDAAMDDLKPLAIDFGALLVEPSAASRLMMTMAQILKHVDSGSPIRFLIAETESGYTLLATLWLARLFGIRDDQIEISPLFETETALENGAEILEEAFRSPHWRAYLRANGRLSLQFGYSDSGRYVGQLAAGPMVERLRLRTLELMKEHGLEDIALTMFDTHGESIGRGAHPFSLKERLEYFSPANTRQALHKAGIASRVEAAFQGGDGYLAFGTDRLAASTIATLAEFVAAQGEPIAADKLNDPLFSKPDFAMDFFSTIALKMGDLVNDPGYTALLSAFGPALVDKTGSRPSARQSDTARVTRITHPSQIRAIPNNAILQQLGWWANVLHGLGSAARRHTEQFERLRHSSPRFRQLMDFASQALNHSDLDVLRATIHQLDPGTWLNRAADCDNADDRVHFLNIARDLEELEFWKSVPALFRRIQREDIALRSAWPEAPRMDVDEKLLHVIRFALMDRIWTLGTHIPYFGPRGTLTREAITTLILCLDVPRALRLLDDLFPITAPSIADLDFGEPGGAAVAQGFAREHREIFQPLQNAFDLLREVGVAIMHANHCFG